MKLVLFDKLDVPVKIIPPRLRHLLEADGDSYGRYPVRLDRSANEAHGCLMGHAPSFFPVAVHAACYNILPFGPPSPGLGKDMVIGEFLGWESIAAILAFKSVPGVYILSGKFDRALDSFYHAEKTYYCRHFKGETYRMDLLGVFLYDLNLSKT